MENQLQIYTADMLIAGLVHPLMRSALQSSMFLAVSLKFVSLSMLWTNTETTAANCYTL